jgi:hypothetical protein
MSSFVPTEEETNRISDDMILKIVSYVLFPGWTPSHEAIPELSLQASELAADADRLLPRPGFVKVASVLEGRSQMAVIPHPGIDCFSKARHHIPDSARSRRDCCGWALGSRRCEPGSTDRKPEPNKEILI